MPIELAGFRVPGPVRLLGVGEDDPRARIFLVGIAPDIPVARARLRIAAAGALYPPAAVGGMSGGGVGKEPSGPLRGVSDERGGNRHGSRTVMQCTRLLPGL